ncbi:hypothetical protein [Paraherbaspirillum soli]|uniref:Uncharacterized protein n=1 Tax=Paraherbaspirillum soli TaxID=631222 RepID=A0ABW0M9N0_9BURK
MRKLSLKKSRWTGNKWPSVDIDPYEFDDFLKVVTQLCNTFSVAIPHVIDILDGYATDLVIENSPTKVLMDNWTFSVAAEKEDVRDKIYIALESISI